MNPVALQEADGDWYTQAMERMIAITQDLAASHDLETVMDIVRRAVRSLIGSDGATFVLRDGDQCFYADEDAIQPLWKGQRFPMKDCVSGWVMINHQTAVIPDLFLDDRVPHSIYEPTFVRSMVIVPVRSKDPIASIGCYWSSKHDASPNEVRILQMLASMTAVTLENTQIEAELRQKTVQLEQAIESTFLSVSRMVDLRDSYTAGHQRRVGRVAADIAEKMGLGQETCRAIYWAGVVHDIGKISIPAEILSKPTKLSSIEMAWIRMHAETGYEILKDVDMPFPIAQIVRQHHERLDGSGYPQGLEGGQILPEASILAVADVFEAIVSHRPYRPALGYDVALKEIQDNRGTRYDAAAVDTLTRMVQDQGYLIPD